MAPPAGPAYNFIVNLYVLTPGKLAYSELTQSQLYLPWCLDQRLRRCWTHLPALQEIRAVDLTVAYVPAYLRYLSARQHLPRSCSLYPSRGQLGRRWLPILCLPSCRCRCSAAWCRLLGLLDQGFPVLWRLQGCFRANFQP